MQKLDFLVIASKNPSKVARYSRMFTPVVTTVVGIRDMGIYPSPIEVGHTAKENSELKARHYATLTQEVVFSEDESLFVDFLPDDKQPGVYVRRINGVDDADDDTLLKYWEKLVSAAPIEQRKGRWEVAYTLATPQGEVKTTIVQHPVLFFSPSSPIRMPGWPLSSVEGPMQFGKPHSELTSEEQYILSQEHRRQIVEALFEGKM